MMKYPKQTSYPCPKVREMSAVTATALKNQTAEVLERMTREGAVAITRHNKPKAVLIPYELYEELTGGDEAWLDDLRVEYRGMLAAMQLPGQREIADRLFEATPEELAEAAVRGAKQNSAGAAK